MLTLAMNAEVEWAGTLKGRYAVEREIGKGGLGVVWLARDIGLERWVAIKKIHSETAEAELRARAALAEAQKLAVLQHPNIVTVLDIFEDGEDAYIVMEYVHGYTLETLGAPVPRAEFLEIARQALEGLAAAHAAGMVHRDIKPTNIMLSALPTGKYQVKLMDFGLAKIQNAPSPQTTDHGGSLVGSVFYMAPEQFEQQPVDVRTDLYALGCVFYRLLAMRDPFPGNSEAAVIAAHLAGCPVPLGNLRPDLPGTLCAWVGGLMARNPNGRPSSAAVALDGLARALDDGRINFRPTVQRLPVTGRKFPAVPLLVGAGMLVAAGAYFFVRPPAEKNKDRAFTVASAVNAPVPDSSSGGSSGGTVYSTADREGLLGMAGKEVVVEGKLARAGENKTGTIRFLNFAGTSREDLCLVFFLDGARDDFSMARLEQYIGKMVSVKGKVSVYRGNPQIEIVSLGQISLR